MPALTKRESLEQRAERLYQFIYDQYEATATPPSWKEMAIEAKASEKTVRKLIDLLESKGMVTHRRGKWRGVFPRRK